MVLTSCRQALCRALPGITRLRRFAQAVLPAIWFASLSQPLQAQERQAPEFTFDFELTVTVPKQMSPVATLIGPAAPILDMEFADVEGRKLLLAVDGGSNLNVWDLSRHDGKKKMPVTQVVPLPVGGTDLTVIRDAAPDGRPLIAIGMNSGLLGLLEPRFGPDGLLALSTGLISRQIASETIASMDWTRQQEGSLLLGVGTLEGHLLLCQLPLPAGANPCRKKSYVHKLSINDVAFTDDGSDLLSSDINAIKVTSLETGKTRTVIAGDQAVMPGRLGEEMSFLRMVYHPQLKAVIVSSLSRLHAVDVSTGAVMGDFDKMHEGRIVTMSFIESRDEMLTVGEQAEVIRWSLASPGGDISATPIFATLQSILSFEFPLIAALDDGDGGLTASQWMRFLPSLFQGGKIVHDSWIEVFAIPGDAEGP